jgi:threonine/homoserine/homoserine lactone efflux protein
LAAYPGVLQSAQWIGVIYLCWMGLKLLWTSASEQATQQAKQQSAGTFFRQALAVSLTNPKVIMFFMAFFPLFMSVESGPITLFVLMIHVTSISLIYQTGLVTIGNATAKRLAKWRFVSTLTARLAGIALIGFGLKLAFSIRR